MAVVHEELGDVETDATGADHGHALANRLPVQQHVEVRQHARMILPGNVRAARCNAGGQHDLVAIRLRQSDQPSHGC